MNVHKNARLTPHSRAVLVHRVMVEGEKNKAKPESWWIAETAKLVLLAL
ncbi:MAG: leucine zipper domain-containing protein [Hyphomicrobiales bacterium]|nr:leucine zipper domain-containing protein [Hyphomicrobiales bacterium]